MKYFVKIVLSLACTLLIFAFLLGLARVGGGEVSPARIVEALRNALPLFVAIYVIAQFAQTIFRALRARLLLKASLPENGQVPGLFHIVLVTFVRGACADMLPARLGELSYVAMLNKGCDIPAADGLSSLSIGLLFDFIALLAVLAVAIPAAAQGMSLVGSLILLALICLVGSVGLFILFPAIANRLGHLAGKGLFRYKLFAVLLKIVTDTADAVVKTRRAGIALRVTVYSLAVRFAKYAGLYCLFVAVTRPLWPALSQAGLFPVLVALIAAEGAASLPVPTFMSFGSYEAGGLAALTALGFAVADSMAAMLAMHVLSQIIDYSLGGLAFLVFTWTVKPAAHPARGTNVGAKKSRRLPLFIATTGVLLLLLLFTAFQYRAVLKRGRLTPPPVGEPRVPAPEAVAAREAALRAFGGKIVWSSNRSGSHDLWLLEGNDFKPRRLTHSVFTDTYPRFSPDGRQVAFARSTEPWVSQRNLNKWDTWVIDLASGRERRVATNAYQACWNVDADNKLSLLFLRRGGNVLASCTPEGVPLPDKLISGRPPLNDGEFVTLPDGPLEPLPSGEKAFLVTIRGARNATAYIWHPVQDAPAEIKTTSGGCQMVWRRRNVRFPSSSESSGDIHEEREVVWVDHPGRKKNAFYTFDYSEPDYTKRQRVVLLDAEAPWSHEYFPRFTEGGRWLVFGASKGDHEQDSADYEIFLYDTAHTNVPPARLTFHTGNDCWPDIFLPAQ